MIRRLSSLADRAAENFTPSVALIAGLATSVVGVATLSVSAALIIGGLLVAGGAVLVERGSKQ